MEAPMEIARIETFIFGTGSSKDLLFCRVETEDGLHGWGEAYVTQGKEKVVAECIQSMAPHVIGRSAFNIRHTGQVMYEDFAIKRGSPELLAAWSAVEIASWDILGKRAGLPVYNLIGGASRERVRVYANGWSRGTTIEERVERGLQVKAMGFTAAKFDPFPGPWRSFVDGRDEDFAIDYVRARRQAVVMAPHNYNSTLVGLAATVHVSAVIPNFRIAEYFVNFQDLCREISTASLTVQDGWVDLPTSPGLGVDIDVERLRAHPHQEATHRGFRQYWEEYPRKGYAPSLR